MKTKVEAAADAIMEQCYDGAQAISIARTVLIAASQHRPADLCSATWIAVPCALTTEMAQTLHDTVRIRCNPDEQTASILNEQTVWSALLAAAPHVDEAQHKPPTEDDITQSMIQAGRYAANLNDGTLARIYLAMRGAERRQSSDYQDGFNTANERADERIKGLERDNSLLCEELRRRDALDQPPNTSGKNSSGEY